VIPKHKNAASIDDDQSIMIESENLKIIGKNAIKSKGVCEKTSLLCKCFVKTYKTAFHYWLTFYISKISITSSFCYV
jgi:hypothetical protein